MSWIKFQADKEKLLNIFHAVFTKIDGVLYETYSVLNQELRHFESVAELESAFEIGFDKFGNGTAQQLSLWVSNIMPKPNIRTIELKTGDTRKVVEGCGLFSFLLGGERPGGITTSKIGYFTEAGAKRKCTVTPGPDDVNWINHKKVAETLRNIVKRSHQPVNHSLQRTPEKRAAAELKRCTGKFKRCR